MLRKVVSMALAILSIPILAFSQGSTPISFEVASIKPAETLSPEMILAGKMHVGFSIDNSRVDIGYVSLSDLIPIAFKLKPHQISGPDWLKSSQRFDILAKFPEGATKEQLPEMLQSLLEERFHLKYHRETRDLPIYALIVAKGGHKLKDSEPESKDPIKGALTLNAGGQKVQISPTQGGATINSNETGKIKMAMDPETQQMRMEYGKLSMAQFAQLLTRLVDRPVFDKTDLKGNYQIALSLSMDAMMAIAKSSGINVPLPPTGATGTASDPSGSSSIMSAIQQLGLKLDAQKESVEFLVIDNLDKMPTDN